MRAAPFLAVCFVAAGAAAVAAEWRVELALGAADSFGSTLRVEQEGQPALELAADWATRSFEPPLYYALRVARGDARGAWALRFLHHKLHLENTTAELELFGVSHGYNLLTLERSFARGGFELALGAGLVIGHPESTVRGRSLGESESGPLGGGYHLTGPTGALAVGRRLPLGRHLALVPELRVTLSRARVPVAAGEASVPNAAVHLLVGLEARF